MFDISVLGDKELQAKLLKMEKRVGAKIMKQSLKSAMEPVKNLAKIRAPQKSGRLRKSIRIGTKSNRRGVSALLRTGTRKQLKIPADAKYYYPAAIEYGAAGRHLPERSFLRSSLHDRKGQVIGSVARHIRNNLESVK